MHTEQKAHSDFGPSRLEQIALCPGSVKAQQGLPDTSSPEAQKGTDLHAIVAEAILSGKVPELDDADDQTAVNACLELVASIKADFDSDAEVIVEKRLNCLGIHQSIGFGTADFAIYEPFGRGVLVDWKFGRSQVTSADRNLQMRCYAMALAQDAQLESITVIIFQPFINWRSERVYVSDEFADNTIMLRKIIDRANEPDAKRIPGEKQCAYCKAAGQCPENAKPALELATTAKPEDVKLASREDLARWLTMVPAVKAFCAALESTAFAILSDGGEIPGWRLTAGRPGNRQWNEGVEPVLLELARDAGKDTVDLYEHSLLSPAKVEKLLGKAAAKKLADLTYRPEGKLKLERIDQN